MQLATQPPIVLGPPTVPPAGLFDLEARLVELAYDLAGEARAPRGRRSSTGAEERPAAGRGRAGSGHTKFSTLLPAE